MTITFKEFQINSKRTAPFNAEPTNTQEMYNILGNYSMGLVGEYFEYKTALNKVGEVLTSQDINDVYKESGDVLHYAVNLLTLLQEEFTKNKIVDNVSKDQEDEALSNVLEIPKKYIYHGHAIDKEKLVDSIYVIVSKFHNAYSISFNEIMKMNIEKLSIRYPENFNTQDSINRVDTK